MQDKWTDFDEHYNICKQGRMELNRSRFADTKNKPTTLDLIEKVLAEKGVTR